MNEANLHPQREIGALRSRIRDDCFADEAAVLGRLVDRIKLSEHDRRKVAAVGAGFVERVRKETSPSMMEGPKLAPNRRLV